MGKKVVETFKEILDGIKSTEFRHLVKQIILKAPDYIVCIPSSSTGKYHPQDEIDSDGMIKHVNRCAAIVPDIIRMKMESDEPEFEYIQDILLASCVLHDIFKNGEESSKKNDDGIKLGKAKFTQKNHPALVYNLICQFEDEEKREEMKKYLQTLAYACLFHEGRWTTEAARFLAEKKWNTTTNVNVARLMHLVDYVASRRTFADCFQYTYKDELVNPCTN